MSVFSSQISQDHILPIPWVGHRYRSALPNLPLERGGKAPGGAGSRSRSRGGSRSRGRGGEQEQEK